MPTAKCKICNSSFEQKSPSHETCKTKCHAAYYTEERVRLMILENIDAEPAAASLRSWGKELGPVFQRHLNHQLAALLKENLIHEKRNADGIVVAYGPGRPPRGRRPKSVVVAAPKPAPRVEEKLECPSSVLERMDDTTLQLYAELRKSRSTCLASITENEQRIADHYSAIQAISKDVETRKKELSEFNHDLRELVKGL